MDIATYGSLTTVLYDKINYSSLPIFVTLMWAYSITNAVDHIHSKGIKHRDIKCENILLCDKFKLKLSDFGLSKEANAESKNSFVGTTGFQAPEITAGKGSFMASDIFSLAMTFVQLFFRNHPNNDNHYDKRINKMCDECLATRKDFKANDVIRMRDLLLDCVKFNFSEKFFDPNIRPTAGEVKRRVAEILHNNCGYDDNIIIEQIEKFEKESSSTNALPSPVKSNALPDQNVFFKSFQVCFLNNFDDNDFITIL